MVQTNENTAYLLNSTPKYYYILELHIVLLQRYGCKWNIYFATEEPQHPMCVLLAEKYGVTLLTLEKENSSFLASRKRALELLPSKYTYVLPMQEDFLLERQVDEKYFEDISRLISFDYGIYVKQGDLPPNPSLQRCPCVRLMPCPGPETSPTHKNYWTGSWGTIMNDTYKFSFQATLWRRDDCLRWYAAIVAEVDKYSFSSEAEKNIFEVRNNIAENAIGQALFAKLFENTLPLGFLRKYKAANAVYHCPWPYRPTAIVKGILQPFAKELAQREGVTLTL